jgi:hypothetical protein
LVGMRARECVLADKAKLATNIKEERTSFLWIEHLVDGVGVVR